MVTDSYCERLFQKKRDLGAAEVSMFFFKSSASPKSK